MIQVIVNICADQVIERFINIWVVVPDVELLVITVLGGYAAVSGIGLSLVYPLR